MKEFVYSQPVIEFMTVAVQTCLLLEHTAEIEKTEFIDKSLKLLPLLYLKTQILPIEELALEGNLERFVTEEDYNYIRAGVESLLGTDDTYLEVFVENMRYSDTPIVAYVSENMADIYQELKDMAAIYEIGQEEIMHDAVVHCRITFEEHWGQKLLNVLRALHALWVESK